MCVQEKRVTLQNPGEETDRRRQNERVWQQQWSFYRYPYHYMDRLSKQREGHSSKRPFHNVALAWATPCYFWIIACFMLHRQPPGRCSHHCRGALRFLYSISCHSYRTNFSTISRINLTLSISKIRECGIIVCSIDKKKKAIAARWAHASEYSIKLFIFYSLNVLGAY